MTQPTGLLDKGLAAEEWADLRFFRPLGLRLVQRLAPTRVTADQVTLASLLVGLAGGHLFLYADWRLNALGLLLLLVSDVLDSADGQLARLRGTSTRLGAVLDGLSDYARFLNLYIHLGIRLVLAGTFPLAVILLLGVLAMIYNPEVRINPPLVITEDQALEAFSVIEDALRDAAGRLTR